MLAFSLISSSGANFLQTNMSSSQDKSAIINILTWPIVAMQEFKTANTQDKAIAAAGAILGCYAGYVFADSMQFMGPTAYVAVYLGGGIGTEVGSALLKPSSS